MQYLPSIVIAEGFITDWDGGFNKLLKTTEAVCVWGVFVCINILLLQEHVHCSAAKTLC